MASLNRKFLLALGVEEEKADQILDMHQSVLAEIKTERDEFKDKASKSDSIQKELDETKKALESIGDDGYKAKYDDLKNEFDTFKADVEAKATLAKKDKAYRELLKETGVSEKRLDLIMKVTDLNEIQMDGEKVKDADKLKESIKTDWSDFITSEEHEGAGTENPPAGDEGSKPQMNIPTIF